MAVQVYPPVGFHFKVEISGFPGDIGFQSVSGLSQKISEYAPFYEGGENRFAHRLPNQASYSDLTLVRGMLVGSALIKWFNDAVQNFKFDPRDVTVTLLNSSHEPIDQWMFRNAWAKSWDTSKFTSTENAVVTETIILAYQYFERVGLPPQ